ncbi:MAG: GNAT family N-acetyltransferase [Puniceicoccales bacterium]|jgi:N-acetylglutamate synthase-like GNAT family acetyltransferase|nr:GNAT family N-acetyltransferase [Puniceicoccales bacterium]
MAHEIRIDYLANHQDLIPTIAAWYVKMWRKHCENPSIQHAKTKLLNRLNVDKPNICFVYLHNHQCVGTASLTEKDIPHNEMFSPCLSNLFVMEPYRRQKIGDNLIEYVKRQAKNLGFKKIYLYTMDATIHCWYQKLHWEIIKEDVARGCNIKIMATNV